MAACDIQAQHSVERRGVLRQRTLLAGRLAYGDPAVTLSCGIRNLSSTGAQIELEGFILLPASLRLLLPREGVAHDATIVWRRGLRMGLAFGDAHDLQGPVDRQIRGLQAIWKEMALR
jgi:hypothetical protein